MKVLLGYSPSDAKIFSVHWKDDNGELHERMVKSDGSSKEEIMTRSSLKWALDHLSSSHYCMYPAIVGDIRTAFKYLGKSADLAFLLPEAEIDDGE